MVKTYELVLIVNSKVTEEKQKKILDEVKTALSSTGKLINTTSSGKKILSYPIKKEKEGLYFILTFETEAESMVKLSDKLRLNKDILRYLIVKRK